MFCLLDPTCWFSFVYMRVKGNRLIHWKKNKLSDQTKRTECDRICDKVVCAFYIVSFPMSTSLEILEEKLKKYTNTCRLGMRHDGLDPASSLHHTQGNGEQCVWILRTHQQVNSQDYSSLTESMMGKTIPTWQIYITLWTTWEILKAKDQHQTQQQYNQNVEVSCQCMVQGSANVNL